MLTNDEIESALLQTFEDLKLSTGEKTVLKKLFSELSADFEKLNFIRNKGFEIIKEHILEKKVHELAAVKWLEKLMKLIDSIKNQNFNDKPEVFFSPGTDCAIRIKGLLKGAQKNIKICVFTISDNSITEQILAAHERGVEVQIITDDDKTKDRGSDINFLHTKGLSIKCDNSPNHMHHKFALIDHQILINGSFNWTRSASKYNEENVVVHYDASLVSRFNDRFNDLWHSCLAFEKL